VRKGEREGEGVREGGTESENFSGVSLIRRRGHASYDECICRERILVAATNTALACTNCHPATPTPLANRLHRNALSRRILQARADVYGRPDSK